MPHSPALASRLCRLWCTPTRANAAALRQGFTLVELLVVIGIIGMLTAISVPIVMQALAKARNAAIKAEIDMLHMAIMNYKNQYGSFPPCYFGDTNTAGDLRRESVRRHLRKIFPRANYALTGDSPTPSPSDLLSSQMNSLPLTNQRDEVIVGWLSGYSSNPSTPLTGNPRKPLYDFDKSRINGLEYHPPKLPESPYIYTTSTNYFLNPPTNTQPQPFLEFNAATSEDTNGNNVLDSGEDKNLNGRLDGEDLNQNGILDSGEDVNGDGILNHGLPFNENTFQILCAGRDGVLGTDDDLSNFWPGTRREYLDSLK